MTNYAETSTAAEITTWRAAKLIQCFNPFAAVPVMQFHEVERVALGETLIGEVPTGRTPEISGANPALLIPYINPETYEQVLDERGKPIEGQCWTAEQIMYALACAYIYAAKILDRDNPAPAPGPEPTPEFPPEE